MQEHWKAIGLLIVTASCGTAPPPDPPVLGTARESHAPLLDRASEQEVWCFPHGVEPTHRLVLGVSAPSGQGPVSFSLPLIRCSEVTGFFPSLPSSCVNADSLGPRAWFNGCVTLRETTDKGAIADLDLSWQTPAGAEATCRQSMNVSFGEPTEVLPGCGVRVDVKFLNGGDHGGSG